MPFSIPKRLALSGLLVFGTLLVAVGCSSSTQHVPNSDNRLSALSVSAGALTPAFNISTDSYRLTVDGSVTSTTVTATVDHPSATLQINGTAAVSGQASPAIPLPAGATAIPVTVTAENGVAHTYTVTITRVLSSDATLSGLSLSKGMLAPAFSNTIKAYNVGLYSNQPSVTVTPITTHPRATVTVNGSAVKSGMASAAIPLAVGTTTIPVVVTAEDGTTLSTTNIAVRQLAANMPVWVTSSMNGPAVPSAQITLLNDQGDVLESSIPVDATGYAKLCLDPAGKYTLAAKGTGTAQASLALDASKESAANLYCFNLGMTNFPASAPRITAISTSADAAAWTPVGSNFETLVSNIKYLKVTAIGTAGISPTAWSGFGMGINVDAPAWSNAMAYPVAEVENSVPVVVDGQPFYQSTYIFQVLFNNLTAAGQHTIDVVVYDVANNRTEQKLYVTVTNPVAVAGDPDISAIQPTNVFNVLNTYGISREIFAVTPIDNNGVFYLPQIQFSVLSGTTVPGIRGVELYRSTDGTNFAKVSTTHYSSLNKGTGTYTVYDADPSLKEGVTYYYKVRAFTTNTTTNGGYSLESAATPSQFLPPFTTPLVSPAMSAVTTTRAPKFTFGITNPVLWDPAVSDYFYFYLYIKDKIGNGIFGQAYRYTFATAKFEKASGSTWIDATADCTISTDKTQLSIQFPNTTTLLPGNSYEWSIFGTKGGVSNTTADSAYFLRYVPGTNTLGRARSYGSVYEKTYGAVNGFFTLTLDPAAQ